MRDSIDGLVRALPIAVKRWMPNVADLFDLNTVIPSFRQEVCELISGVLVCEA